MTDLGQADARRSVRHVATVAGGSYAALVLLMWGAFNVHGGLPYETSFPYMSETRSLLAGFLYPADPLRIHTNTFYHVSYLIGEAFRVGGSYVPYQIVYAALWWARGFLTYLLMGRFFARSQLVAYAAGALVIVHASDRALQWVGQLNQFGFIFWMLLAFYALTVADEAAAARRVVVFTVAAAVCEYMSLWSYESQLLLLLIFPLALLILHPARWRRLGAMAAVWYVVPATYLVLTYEKYMSGVPTYQESVIRKTWDVATLLGDWWFNIAASLEFWTWMDASNWKASEREGVLLSVIATSVFAAGGVAVRRLQREDRCWTSIVRTPSTWLAVFATGSVFLALSFPAYLMLDGSRDLWRTQLLSGTGCALVLTAIIGCASYAFGRLARPFAFLVLGGVVIYFGSLAAIQRGSLHRWEWEQYRAAMLQVLRVAPSVKPDTFVVLTNVPKLNDPFRHNMWFEQALWLAYPGIHVGGVYFFADGTPSPGSNVKIEGDRWKWNGTGVAPALRDTSIANTVVVEYEPGGRGRLVTTLPRFLCAEPCAAPLYNPTAAIASPIAQRAARRYRVDARF